MENILSTERQMRVVTVGLASMVSLYLIAALVAEPMRGFAAEDTDGKVSVTVTATASTLECNDANDDGNGDNEHLTLGSRTQGDDTGDYNTARDIHCNVVSNNSAGYTLSWVVSTGSGGANTGYMISENEDTIPPYRYDDGLDTVSTFGWNAAAVPDTQAEWGARLSSTSDSFSENHASRQITSTEWGNDGASPENWARIATGSSVIFASSTDETTDSGDDHYIGFRVEIGSSRAQPTGTYEVEVDFATANDT